MFTFAVRLPRIITLAGAAMAMPVLATSLGAQSSVYSLPCVTGSVAPSDYSELSLNFRDGIWSMRKGVELVSESPELTLAVYDQDANPACSDGKSEEAEAGEERTEATGDGPANPKTKCQFRSNIGSKFIVRVDNSQSGSMARYRLCPY